MVNQLKIVPWENVYCEPEVRLVINYLYQRNFQGILLHVGQTSSEKSAINAVSMKEGLSFVERTCEFARIQFTKYFIEFVLMETNQLFSSDSNKILTRQTCGHRSSRVAGSKRRSLAFYYSVWIWYMFSKSEYRGKSDLVVCMTSQRECGCAVQTSDKFCWQTHF